MLKGYRTLHDLTNGKEGPTPSVLMSSMSGER